MKKFIILFLLVLFINNLQSESADDFFNTANNYAYQADYEMAKKYFEKALEINPNHLNSLLGLGKYYYISDKPIKSIEYFSKIISIDSNNFFAYTALGVLYYVIDDLNNSMINFNKSIKITKKDNVAYILRLVTSFKKSEKDFNKSYKALKNKKKYVSNDYWVESISDFFTSNIDENNLLDEAGTDILKKSFANCLIGYKNLFDGDKNNAKKFFQICLNMNLIGAFEYPLAKKEYKILEGLE